MSGTITLQEVPYDWRLPGTYFEIRPSYGKIGLVDYPTRVLLVGDKLAGGTAALNVPTRITRDDQGAALFGGGSLTDMQLRAFRANNRTTELWAVAIADPSGSPTSATGTITLAGAGVTAAAQVVYWIAGRRVAIIAQPGNTPTQLATALVAAITADPLMPVTAASTAGAVTLTAKSKGTATNALDIRVSDLPDEALPTGVTSTIVAMSGGAGVPDLAPLFAAIGTDWYTDILVPWSDTTILAALNSELAARYNAMRRMDAHAYVGYRGTLSAATTYGEAQNGQFVTMLPADASPSPPWEWAAALVAVAAFYLTNDPARQLRGLALAGIRPPVPAKRWTDQERNLLLSSGMSVWDVLSDDTVVLSRVITMRQRTTLGTEDPAWIDIMVPKTMSRIRYDWESYLTLTYPRNKLADDGSVAAEYDLAVVTPRRLHGAWAGRYQLYERQGWTEGGRTVTEAASFVRNSTNRNRVDSQQPVRIIGNLMVMAGALEFEA